MPVKQGDLGLLQHPASRELLASTIPARLAYIATDGEGSRQEFKSRSHHRRQ